MPYSTELADRIREVAGTFEGVSERRMFGGVVWMLHGNMACGAMSTGDLLVRVDRDDVERFVLLPGAHPAVMGGRTMGGFVTVDEDAVAEDEDLEGWIATGAQTALALPPKDD